MDDYFSRVPQNKANLITFGVKKEPYYPKSLGEIQVQTKQFISNRTKLLKIRVL